ncbi:MAG: hypothetical protein Q9167_005249, partial [Letrouitia subvulpina]
MPVSLPQLTRTEIEAEARDEAGLNKVCKLNPRDEVAPVLFPARRSEYEWLKREWIPH